MKPHEIHKVVAFEKAGSFKLRLEFEDGFSRVVNFEDVLYGQLFSPLRNLAYFDNVVLAQEIHTVVWPNGADFDPETLDHWDQYLPEMRKQIQQFVIS